MHSIKRTVLVLVAGTTSLLATAAFATNYSLWINGRNHSGVGVEGNYADFTYWGSSSVNAGVNKKAVNWDGRSRIADKNHVVRNALDCFCTGDNWCYVATHSAGDLMIGYALSMYGGTTRTKTNAIPNSSGVCGASGKGTQTGWNIKWVNVASGAAGGSELADAGSWLVSEKLVSDLKTSTARAMYDHSNTRSKWFYMYAGGKGSTLISLLLPGQDDGVVAYHSTGGMSGSSGNSFCNPGCSNDLSLGTAASRSNRTKWGYHSVVFRDDREQYSHSTDRNWSGVISRVRADMEKNAK